MCNPSSRSKTSPINPVAQCGRSGKAGYAVHPQACGERSIFWTYQPPFHGSSPRVWGTGLRAQGWLRSRRFIPTRVGNGPCQLENSAMQSVHPHACGERSLPVGRRHVNYGSSPRVWGTVRKRLDAVCRVRFIPTRVGNGRKRTAVGGRKAVHPHACGERPRQVIGQGSSAGSSPRVWGTGKREAEEEKERRFIPTRVGNGRWVERRCRQSSVHPHACGERDDLRNRRERPAGSSPRVWGTELARRQHDTCQRFIPTRVGNGCDLPLPKMMQAVHPHACGERARAIRSVPERNGSSPRVWGTDSQTLCL